ncbi:helix-turn-helix domain-containing protein [Variovorax soli]|uniref:helix-turn-helix domain-containing protein n=1 Tax=Variovorax soli TaxID=376815 RepID=UPI0008399A25|nr:XRE family transcriptional regulator [Variovorax soli]
MKESAAPTAPEEEDINMRIARRVRELRAARAETMESLAARSGVSKSMISLIERGEASPTAAVLEKLAAGLGVAMATLFGPDRSAQQQPLSRRAEQAIWKDPESGYLRRNLTPPNWPTPIQLVEVHFPAGARMAYESASREPALEQQVWVLQGQIELTLGDQRYALKAGDCLAIRRDRPLVFNNPSTQAARYLVAICDQAAVQLLQ